MVCIHGMVIIYNFVDMLISITYLINLSKLLKISKIIFKECVFFACVSQNVSVTVPPIYPTKFESHPLEK